MKRTVSSLLALATVTSACKSRQSHNLEGGPEQYPTQSELNRKEDQLLAADRVYQDLQARVNKDRTQRPLNPFSWAPSAFAGVMSAVLVTYMATNKLSDTPPQDLTPQNLGNVPGLVDSSGKSAMVQKSQFKGSDVVVTSSKEGSDKIFSVYKSKQELKKLDSVVIPGIMIFGIAIPILGSVIWNKVVANAEEAMLLAEEAKVEVVSDKLQAYLDAKPCGNYVTQSKGTNRDFAPFYRAMSKHKSDALTESKKILPFNEKSIVAELRELRCATIKGENLIFATDNVSLPKAIFVIHGQNRDNQSFFIFSNKSNSTWEPEFEAVLGREELANERFVLKGNISAGNFNAEKEKSDLTLDVLTSLIEMADVYWLGV